MGYRVCGKLPGKNPYPLQDFHSFEKKEFAVSKICIGLVCVTHLESQEHGPRIGPIQGR
jgi:hypothetical protein